MIGTICTLTFALVCLGDGASQLETSRQPNPFAPSLRLLTEEEEKQLDHIIDQFILFDIGRLRGEEGKKALSDFQKLGPDAIPALIRGINRAAKIEASCPAVTIGRKLSSLLRGSTDAELLEFARENIGAGITQSRHMAVLKDLRVMCMVRKNQVARDAPTLKTVPVTPAGPSSLRTLTTSQLVAEAAGLERGSRRDDYVTELDKRRPEDVLTDLGAIAGDDSNAKAQKLARELLDRHLARQPSKVLKEKLKDPLTEVRAATARQVGKKWLHFEKELIDLLADEDGTVRQAAHQALVRLNPRADFGPRADADEDARAEAVRRWRDWLAKQGNR